MWVGEKKICEPDRGLQGLSVLTASNTLRVSWSVLHLCVSSCAHNMIVFISSAHSEQQQKKLLFTLAAFGAAKKKKQHCRRRPTHTHIRSLKEISRHMFSNESNWTLPRQPFLRVSSKPAFCRRISLRVLIKLTLQELWLALVTQSVNLGCLQGKVNSSRSVCTAMQLGVNTVCPKRKQQHINVIKIKLFHTCSLRALCSWIRTIQKSILLWDFQGVF